jgi:DNA-binding transcriptional regulator WhiA
MNRKEVNPLKQNVAKVISGTVKNIARISSIYYRLQLDNIPAESTAKTA